MGYVGKSCRKPFSRNAAIVKPATITSYLTEAVVKEILQVKILPEGTLQLICGSAGDLVEIM
jgi:oxepin-CoA hydrolase/3-oxo-5,6-dehydrosuberyl-CoA semialdehyde dehydrogenase